jgi:hypothetical protein
MVGPGRHAELRRGVFGVVFLEALACGVPVVGSEVDGSREALLDGQLGCLVDPNVPEELVKAIADVLRNGSSRQRRFAYRAGEHRRGARPSKPFGKMFRCCPFQVKGRRMVDGTDNKRSKPWGVGATAAFGRNVDDGSALAILPHTRCEGCGTNPIFSIIQPAGDSGLLIPTSSLAVETLPLVRGKRVPYKYTRA